MVISSVNIFNGNTKTRHKDMGVLVEDKQIAWDIKASEVAEDIEGNQKIMMPWLIDFHKHLNQGWFLLAESSSSWLG